MAEYIHVPSQMVQVGGVVRMPTGIRPRDGAMAVAVGADEGVDPLTTDWRDSYGYAFDRVIVATASVPATQETFNLVRTGGSLLFFSGYLKGSTMELQLNDIH